MSRPPRLGILLSHPTQYHAPWFRALASRPDLDVNVFYYLKPSPLQQGQGFGVEFTWDVPVLEGYSYEFLRNTATNPGFGFWSTDTPELSSIIASRTYDAWLINGWATRSDWQAIRSCWSNRLPILIRGDSHLLDRKPLLRQIARTVVLRRWIPRFSRYLTVGRLNEEFYAAHGAPVERMRPVRHFVDNDWFAKRAAESRERRDDLRRQFGILKDDFVFLFAGKLVEKKQPDLAIRAFQIASRHSSGICLLIVGDGALRERCRELATATSLRVVFAGFLNQSKMPDAYAASDALVLPSLYDETWGLVVNEAMASGIPAIVSDRVGCRPDLVIEGVTGSSFAAQDVDGLAKLFSSYAQNPNEVREMGNRARNHVQPYSITQAADNTSAAVHDCLTSRPLAT